MAAWSQVYTFIAGQVPTATNWNANPSSLSTLLSGALDKDNVDSTSADGIGVLNVNQTRTGTSTFTGAVLASTTLTVGVNDTGYDVKFFGASSGAFMEWDESADELEIRGATAAGPGKLLLSTGELTNENGGVLGRIDFQAPLDSAGTDAIEVGASIWAEADATFSSSVNTTDLVFAAATSEAAAAVMRMKKESLSPNTTNGMSLGTTALNWSDLFLDSGAIIDFDSGNAVITHSSGVINVSTGALQVGGVAVATGAGVSLSGSTNNTIVTVTGANAMQGEANAAGPAILNEAATATNPTLIPNKAEVDTGYGWAAADTLTAVTGGTERMRIDANGYVTKPTNCYVSVWNSAADNDVSGDGTVYTIAFDTEIDDIGANFSSTTFTAPVTGKYSVKGSIYLTGINTSHELSLNLITSNRTYRFLHLNPGIAPSDNNYPISIDADMDATDTFTITLTASGSSKVVDIGGGALATFMQIQLIQ